MSKDQKREIISPDVIIVGGGLAGFIAAKSILEESQGKLKPLIISGSPASNASISRMSFRTRGVHSNREFDTDGVLNLTLEYGRRLSDPLIVGNFAANIADAIENVREPFYLQNDPDSYGLKSTKPAGEVMNSLKKHCKDLGAKIIDARVIDIITEPGRVLGVVAEDDSQHFALSSRAVILATGGYAGLWEKNDNVPGAVGLGQLLALKTGLRLRDLEFIMIHPFVEFNTSDDKTGQVGRMIPTDSLAGATVFVNAIQQPEIEAALNKHMVHYIFHEVASKFASSEVLIKLPDKNINVSPAVHFTTGGIEMRDGDCRTEIDGLYACGDIMGGLHGSARLPGNGLCAALVFGEIAAQTALEDLQSKDSGSNFEAQLAESEPLDLKTVTKDLSAIKEALQKNVFGVLNEDGLRKSSEILIKLLPPKPQLNLASLARLVVKASLLRKESRGYFIRSDHDRQKGLYDNSIVFGREDSFV